MNRSFTFNVVPLTTLLVGILVFGLTFCLAGMNFSAYVHGLNSDSKTMITAMEESLLRAQPLPQAERCAMVVAPHLFRRSLIMTLTDSEHRATILFHSLDQSKKSPTILVGLREDPPIRPLATLFYERFIMGLANMFGLETARSHWKDVTLDVRANDILLAEEVQHTTPIYAGMLGIALTLSYLFGTTLNRHALKPLHEVTRALERLSSDTLALESLPAANGDPLARLTLAYNGAVEKVQTAFAERDQANTSMRQFIADAGHQLRTPLTVIRGFITLLAENKPISPQEHSHCLHVMLQQSLVMGELIDNLILLDRWEKPSDLHTLTPIDIQQFLVDIIDAHRELHVKREINFLDHTVTPLLVLIDPQELHYAMTNLLDNALKYTDGFIEIMLSITLDMITISIRDEGPGMPPSVTLHVFDRFCRGHRRDVEGSGLGLAIAKRAIERAQGSLTVQSSESTGSIFTIQLPWKEQAVHRTY